MKITVDSNKLLRVCSAAAKNINSKVAIPVLENFLIEAAPISGIYITAANDSDFSRYLVDDAQVEDVDTLDKFCISSSQILGILKALPQQPVEISASMLQANIYWNNRQGHATLPVENAELFPTAKTPTQRFASLPLMCLRDAMTNVAYCSADDELRPIMSGMLFDFSPNHLVCVASDGHRLTKATVSDVKTDEDKQSFVVSRRAQSIVNAFIEEVRRVDTEAEVSIHFDDRKVAFEAAGHSIALVLTEGRYPNYNSVIPTSNPMSACVNRDALMGAIRRTMVFTSRDTSLLKLNFTPDTLIITAEDKDFSISSEERIPVQMSGLPGLVIGIKGTFLLEVLGHLYTEDVHIEGSDSTRAIIIRGIDDESDRLTLLMPMLLN